MPRRRHIPGLGKASLRWVLGLRKAVLGGLSTAISLIAVLIALASYLQSLRSNDLSDNANATASKAADLAADSNAIAEQSNEIVRGASQDQVVVQHSRNPFQTRTSESIYTCIDDPTQVSFIGVSVSNWRVSNLGVRGVQLSGFAHLIGGKAGLPRLYALGKPIQFPRILDARTAVELSIVTFHEVQEPTRDRLATAMGGSGDVRFIFSNGLEVSKQWDLEESWGGQFDYGVFTFDRRCSQERARLIKEWDEIMAVDFKNSGKPAEDTPIPD
jgi:hypothetical protein